MFLFDSDEMTIDIIVSIDNGKNNLQTKRPTTLNGRPHSSEYFTKEKATVKTRITTEE